MNKKQKKLKKDIKRGLESIQYKKVCKSLKDNFLRKYKTAIYDNSYYTETNPNNFHENWGEVHPTITSIENGNDYTKYAPLNMSKLINNLVDYLYKNNNSSKYLVGCCHPKIGSSWIMF